MSQVCNRVTICSILLSLTFLQGCWSGSNDGRPTPVPTSGMVSYNGEPCGEAKIVFAPQDHEFASVAETDSEGHFSLQTFAPGDGAVPGEFRVIVSKFEAIDLPGGGFKETFFLPQKYRDPETSGLTATVPIDGTDSIKIELTD